MSVTPLKRLDLPPLALVATLLALLVLAAMARSCRPVDLERAPVRLTRIVTDTIWQYLPPDTIAIVQLRPVTIERTPGPIAQVDTAPNGRLDTVLIAERFNARVDTTLPDRTRLRAMIAFPPLALSDVVVDVPADSVPRIRELFTLTETITETVTEPWHMEALRLLGAAAIGYGVRWLTEPDRIQASSSMIPPAPIAVPTAALRVEVRFQ